MYALPQRPLNKLVPHEYLAIPEFYRQQRQCVLCNEAFYEYSNMGQLRCRLHPGELRYYEDCNCTLYSCCARDPLSVGCVQCDHMDAYLADTLPQRWNQLKEWMLKALPHGLFWFGVQVPFDQHVLMNRASAIPQRVQLSVELTDCDTGPLVEQLSLDSEEWHRRVMKVASTSVLLQQVLGDNRDERQRRRDDALSSLEQRRQRRQGGLRTEGTAQDDDESASRTRLPSFIPFLVLRRVAL